MRKLNDFILLVLFNSMLVLGGCTLAEVVFSTEWEAGYYTGAIILVLSTMLSKAKRAGG
jgi:hypothetical protein